MAMDELDLEEYHHVPTQVAVEASTDDMASRVVEHVSIDVYDLSVKISPCRPTWNRFVHGNTRAHAKTNTGSQEKIILKNINSHMPSGSLTAILGASGSGKTCLLDALSHRRDSSDQLRSVGKICYNRSSDFNSIRSAYVTHVDALLPELTVRETLQFAADLRLPSTVTRLERRHLVEEVILELGLKHCASTRIGSHMRKSCSGGEKRRTSLGVQMLSNPAVLFLDEVTTGLDALSAFQLIRTLKRLATHGRTIIVTIHQPRSEIWTLFDNLLLLSEGSLLYSGSASEAITYFERLGYSMPTLVNPSEFLLDLSMIDKRSSSLESSSRNRIAVLVDAWQKTSQKQMIEESIKKPNDEPRVNRDMNPELRRSFFRTTSVQTTRATLTSLRDPLGATASLLEAVILGIISGWIFYKTDESLSGIKSREGALYCAAVLQGYLVLLQETYRLSSELPHFDSEHQEGIVSALSFLTSRRLAKLLLEDVTVPLLFSITFYFLAGFRLVASQFLVFYAVVLLVHFVSVMLASVCVAAFRDFARASLIANLSFTLQSICSGLFIQSNRIPVYVRWVKYIAYVWYANGALICNEFLAHTRKPAGQLYACPERTGSADPACRPYTGAFIVDSLGLPFKSLSKPIAVLVSFIVIFFLTSAALLEFYVPKTKFSSIATENQEMALDAYDEDSQSVGHTQGLNVELCDYELHIRKLRLSQRRMIDTPVLKTINATFQVGSLNVIMGSSGSGKTSLLNMISDRLHSSLFNSYVKKGYIMLGGSRPSEPTMRNVLSFVEQEDEHLIPTLTVRETLRYAAGLRLPSSMSAEHKIQSAESVIERLNLQACANTMVGGSNLRGISRGEKRRVSIGVQLLTDPHILILDEPTSGLDAFTARSIIDILRSLAVQGKTIILSIHQPRSDMFQYFGNILLLSRGGQPMYAGKASAMLPYFSKLGYDCPPAMNPADFVLDLVTVDLQHETVEAATGRKVSALAANWASQFKRAESSRVNEACATARVMSLVNLTTLRRGETPLHIAVPLLLQRSAVGFRRKAGVLDARIAQVFGFAVITTLFWAPLKNEDVDIQSRVGFIQHQMGLYFVGMLQNVALYPSERNLFYSEHGDGAYSVEAFILQYTLLEIPFEIASSFLFAVLVTFAVGLPRSASMFFIEAFNCFCLVNCGESLGIMFNTFFDHSGFAFSMTSVILSLALMMAGVLSVHLPPVLHAFNHLSPAKWALGNLASYSLAGQVFTCSESERLANNDGCLIGTGQEVLNLYNLVVRQRLYVMALGICVVVYRVMAYALLKFKRSSWTWRALLSKTKDKETASAEAGES